MGIEKCVKEVSFEEGKNIGATCTNVLAYEMSKVVFGREKFSEINWEECTEAYFFDESKQVHMFLSEDGWKAIVFEEKDQLSYVDKTNEILSKFKGEGKDIVRREYLAFDEDGQTYVAYTRLVAIQ